MSEDAKQIHPKQFKSLVAAKTSAKTKVAEINGEIGERLKSAQENANLHLKAFGVICTLHRMPEDKREAFRDALELYLDYADEHLWGDGHAGDLVKEAQKPTDEEVGAANAKKVEQGIKQLDPESPLGRRKAKGLEGAEAASSYKVN